MSRAEAARLTKNRHGRAITSTQLGQRTSHDRLDAIPGALSSSAEMKARIAQSEGDTLALADLMAECIDMNRGTRRLEIVDRNGHLAMCLEEIISYHCMDYARAAYGRARGEKNAGQ